MAIDEDILPYLNDLEQRLGVRVDAAATKVDRLDQLIQQLGAFDASTAGELTTIKRRLESLEASTPPAPGGGGKGGDAVVVAASNASAAIKAEANVVLTGTGDAAAINRITDPVRLTDGVYLLEQPLLIKGRGATVTGFSYKTVLMKAQQFTNAGRGATPALIKIADTADGNEACAIQIRDLFLVGRFFAGYGTGAPSGSPIAGVWLEITGDKHNDRTLGFPLGGPDGSDNWSSLSRLRVFDTTTGVYVTSTDGARGFEYVDIGISTLQSGGVGLHIAASDARIDRVTATAGNASNAAGFRVAGGNAIMSNCKAFFFRQAGSVGFDITSSRPSLSNCEAQDNRVGFKVGGVNAKLTGCRVDNMLAGMDVGLDLSGASHFSVTGQIVQTRSPGTYATGIAVPNNTTTGVLDAYVDASAITNAVTKGGVAVTTSSAMPVNVEARVVTRTTAGVKTLRRELP